MMKPYISVDYSWNLAQQIAAITREFLPKEVSMEDEKRYGKWYEAVSLACSQTLNHMQGIVDEVVGLKVDRAMLEVAPTVVLGIEQKR